MLYDIFQLTHDIQFVCPALMCYRIDGIQKKSINAKKYALAYYNILFSLSVDVIGAD